MQVTAESHDDARSSDSVTDTELIDPVTCSLCGVTGWHGNQTDRKEEAWAGEDGLLNIRRSQSKHTHTHTGAGFKVGLLSAADSSQ